MHTNIHVDTPHGNAHRYSETHSYTHISHTYTQVHRHTVTCTPHKHTHLTHHAQSHVNTHMHRTQIHTHHTHTCIHTSHTHHIQVLTYTHMYTTRPRKAVTPPSAEQQELWRRGAGASVGAGPPWGDWRPRSPAQAQCIRRPSLEIRRAGWGLPGGALWKGLGGASSQPGSRRVWRSCCLAPLEDPMGSAPPASATPVDHCKRIKERCM